MFKRVEKRRRKQEEEEELGLDDDIKDVLGINDTDSDESDSDSDGSESEAEGKEGEADGDEEKVEDEDEDEDSSDDGDEAEEPSISVAEALRDPVYVVSLQPDVKACIVCPGKLIKSADILTLHQASKASVFHLIHRPRLQLRDRHINADGANSASSQSRLTQPRTPMHGTY
jgi:hypothetical protein